MTEVTKAPEEKSILELFETSADLEKTGVWLDFKNYGKIKIARAGGENFRYLKAFESALRPHRRLIEMGAFPEDEGRDLMIDVYSSTIVLDWQGIRGRDKVLIPFSKENCVAMLKKIPALFAFVQEKANNFSNFRDGDIEDEIKN